MGFRINHIHLKSADPQKSAAWFCEAFGFTVLSDTVRPAPFGDRFVRCMGAESSMAVNISGPRTGETLGPADFGVVGRDQAREVHVEVRLQ